MQLSRNSLQAITPRVTIDVPDTALFELPEKVLQFGTGVLLRGLPGFFIDKANKRGLFNGRIVVVKSTDAGGVDAFAAQDGLYTQCIRGMEQGKTIDEYVINAAVSRVLSAKTEWDKIRAVAKDPQLQIVISNTTELGIVPGDDKITDAPPATFPGKLLVVLYERFRALGAQEAPGLVIIPTELIVDNGRKLKALILENAAKNDLGTGFIQWVENKNHFCNSLVDRIVPGKLEPADEERTSALLGYRDELKLMSEVFRLWAIESDSEEVKNRLSFAKADEGVVIAPDIEKFRELKLRLLNGTHTFSCALALLAGFETVKEAMDDEAFEHYIAWLTKKEIAPVLEKKGIRYNESVSFADKVIERFKNPYLDHKWSSISFAYTSKMLLRNLPLIKESAAAAVEGTPAMALGFAAYLLLFRSRKKNDYYEREIDGKSYRLNDDKAAILSELWEQNDESHIVDAVLACKALWGEDWSGCTQFTAQTKQALFLLVKDGVIASLNTFAGTEVN